MQQVYCCSIVSTRFFVRIALSAVLLVPASAFAGKVYVGVAPSEVSSANLAGFQTRYKIDLTNWDAMIGNGTPVSPTSIQSTNLSNTLGTLSGAQYTYRVVNTPGSSLTFSLLHPSGAPSASFSWTTTTPLGGVGVQSVSYNALHPYAQATFAGSSVAFQNASFTLSNPVIQTLGTLPTSGLANNAAPINDSYIVYVNDDGSKGDLGSIGWTFEAQVTITSSGNSREGAKFELSGKTLDFTPPSSPVVAVPETSTWVMGIMALGAALVVVRKSRRTQR